MTKFIDLSIPITTKVISDPPQMLPQIHYTDHAETWAQIALFFPGLTKQDLPDGEGWAVETLTLSTHNGTHMDAPWHYHSTTDSGARPAPTIDEAPLDRFFRPGVKLDFSHLPHGHVVTAAEVEAELARIAIRCNRSTSCWSNPVLSMARTTSPIRASAWARKRHCG